jgi:hypothetical protein
LSEKAPYINVEKLIQEAKNKMNNKIINTVTNYHDEEKFISSILGD